MKYFIKLSLVVVLFSAAISCKKEKEESDPILPKKASIEGEWRMSKFEQKGETTTANDSTINTFDNYGSNFTGIIDFGNDNTYQSSLRFDFNINISQASNTTSATLDANLMLGSGDWEIDASNNLVIDPRNNPWKLEITRLNEEKLSLRSEEEYPSILLNGDTGLERSVYTIEFDKKQ